MHRLNTLYIYKIIPQPHPIVIGRGFFTPPQPSPIKGGVKERWWAVPTLQERWGAVRTLHLKGEGDIRKDGGQGTPDLILSHDLELRKDGGPGAPIEGGHGGVVAGRGAQAELGRKGAFPSRSLGTRIEKGDPAGRPYGNRELSRGKGGHMGPPLTPPSPPLPPGAGGEGVKGTQAGSLVLPEIRGAQAELGRKGRSHVQLGSGGKRLVG